MPKVIRHSHIQLLPIPRDVQVPSCCHGPGLLFGRSHSASASVERFYACSACRDRKSCPLFVPADPSGRPSTSRSSRSAEDVPQSSRQEAVVESRLLAAARPPDLAFCRTCGLLVTSSAAAGPHRDHALVCDDVRGLVRQPTLLLAPLTANKANAQFLFSMESLALILRACLRSGASLAVCVGCPRLHEVVLCFCRRWRRRKRRRLRSSLLLDLDERFEAFYGREHFLRYNMFNHHLFSGHGEAGLAAAVDSTASRFIVVCDPPFGGLVEPLAESLRRVKEELSRVGEVVGSVLVMPYFMEKKIVEHLGDLKMLDFPITYTNHAKLSNAEESTVRLFTDLPAEVWRPVADQAGRYRFCAPCQRYSALTNRHCSLCGSCTTKHGSTPYRHCRACGRCVKPKKHHCVDCGWCVLPDEHSCGREGGQTIIHR